MLISEFTDRYTSGRYTFANVVSEFRELLEAKTTAESVEEYWDVVMAAQLWFHSVTGLDATMLLPEQHIAKFERRRGIWMQIFAAKGMVFSPRYLAAGSNFQKPEKIEAALAAARREQEATC